MTTTPEHIMTLSIIPTLRYEDAARMIDWLCDTFGFEREAVYTDDQGRISHAQLTFGDGMIMLSDHIDNAFGQLQSTPSQLGGTTQSAYIVVADDADVDAIWRKARAASARIVIEPNDEDYGGRGFSCFDPEGHLWNFGSYDPTADGSKG